MQKLCVPDLAKNIDIKLFNLMSRSNETALREKCPNMELFMVRIFLHLD